MVTHNGNYELKYHKCSLKFILNFSVIENFLNAKNSFYLMYLFFRPMYSALASNLTLPTTPLLGSKQNKLKESLRTLHIEELLTLYSTSHKICVIKDYKSGADMPSMGQNRNTYRVLVRKPVRKRLPGRPRRRWE